MKPDVEKLARECGLWRTHLSDGSPTERFDFVTDKQLQAFAEACMRLERQKILEEMIENSKRYIRI